MGLDRAGPGGLEVCHKACHYQGASPHLRGWVLAPGGMSHAGRLCACLNTRSESGGSTRGVAAKWMYEAFSGGRQWCTADRQGLTAALDYVRPGDTLVVWRLDRLGRSLGQLIMLMNTLHDQQVGFQSLVEAIDTTTATGQFFFQITGAFAELERNLMRERTQAGLASARRRGRKGGRRKAIDAKTFAMALQLYEARTSSVQQICTRLGIAQRTFYRDLAAHQASQQEQVAM